MIDSDFMDGRNFYNLTTRLNQSVFLKGDTGSLEISCRDFASTAWNIYQNSTFFQHKHDIGTWYRDDTNGGGDQLLEIFRNGSHTRENVFFIVSFSVTDGDDWVYEADLKMDGRKDYHPTVNHGKRKFGGNSIKIYASDSNELLSWINENYLSWVDELSRISRPHSTLSEWVDSGLDMGVRCSDFYCNNNLKVIPNSDLMEYLKFGLTMVQLMERLACSTCRKRHPRVSPFS